jgi:hypothetical protein
MTVEMLNVEIGLYRTITSIGVVLALLVVAAGSPCLGCSDMLRKAGQHGCCKESSRCPMPMKKAPAHEECASPATGLPTVELKLTTLSASLAVITVTASVLVRPAVRTAPPGDTRPPHSPPDLCLLNSVLTL